MDDIRCPVTDLTINGNCNTLADLRMLNLCANPPDVSKYMTPNPATAARIKYLQGEIQKMQEEQRAIEEKDFSHPEAFRQHALMWIENAWSTIQKMRLFEYCGQMMIGMGLAEEDDFANYRRQDPNWRPMDKIQPRLENLMDTEGRVFQCSGIKSSLR
ncbi:hypothetical protein E8E13_010868 [Curvularia kusanoi]|uniref:Uncharacterized protein n=1 Tax=Curvularia kusanoi TaxID=90978 RepID=A0A9P4TPL3_CURKU|nr:hypothetical protein E8E13_010868 [Curvularia kusanoi]